MGRDACTKQSPPPAPRYFGSAPQAVQGVNSAHDGPQGFGEASHYHGATYQALEARADTSKGPAYSALRWTKVSEWCAGGLPDFGEKVASHRLPSFHHPRGRYCCPARVLSPGSARCDMSAHNHEFCVIWRWPGAVVITTACDRWDIPHGRSGGGPAAGPESPALRIAGVPTTRFEDRGNIAVLIGSRTRLIVARRGAHGGNPSISRRSANPCRENQRLATPGCTFRQVEAFNPLGRKIGAGGHQRRSIRESDRANGNRGRQRQTGIGLAMVCAAKGYPLVVTMAEQFSVERRRLMRFLGAKVVLTPQAQRGMGMVTKAVELAKAHGWFLTRQFENEANPDYHSRTTAQEIIEDFKGESSTTGDGLRAPAHAERLGTRSARDARTPDPCC